MPGSDTEEIEDAPIIEEKAAEKTEPAAKEEQPAEEKAEKPAAKKSSSKKTTPLPKEGSTSGAGENGAPLDWGDNEDVVKAFINTPTKESSAESAEPHLEGDGKSTEEEDAYIRGEGDNEEEEQMSISDLKDAAGLCIELIDGLNSIGVGAFAKESASKFELTGSKKKMLTVQLAKVFFKYQAKVGPLATLIIGLLLYLGMTWRMGWEVRKEKQVAAEQKDIDARKEKNRAKKEAFRNKIMAAVGVEQITLKEIGERMGDNPGKIKPEVNILCGNGLLFADHSKAIIHYRIAE